MYIEALNIKEKNRKRFEKIVSWTALVVVIIFMIFFIGCGGGGNSEPIITDPTPPVPVIEDNDNETETGPIKFIVNNGGMKFFDGDNLWQWKTGVIKKAGSQLYSCDDILYSLDEYGETVQSWNLITTPDVIRVNGTDKWIIKNIDPETAYAAGALYKDYTQIYLNSDIYGDHWSTRQYKAVDMQILNNNVFIKDDIGNWHAITSEHENIRHVNDEFILHDFDSSTKRAKFNDIQVSWSTNYFNNATQWIKADGIWYNERGYTWDGATLTENGTSMSEWNNDPQGTGYTEAPVLIAAGSHYENSEDVIYFIECNSGWLIKYISSIDNYELSVRLYNGDGSRETGLLYKDVLKPIIIENHLYFIMGETYKHDFITGLTAHFASGVNRVLKY